VNEATRKRRGRNIPLSTARRIVIDYMWASKDVPTVEVARQMKLPDLISARQGHPQRPAWPAIFAKAFALVALEIPELRRAYIKLPWHHLHEYPESTVSILSEREVEGDITVVPVRFRTPESLPVVDLSRMLRASAEGPLDSKFDRWIVRTAHYPFFIRRIVWWLFLNVPRMRRHTAGTFTVSSAAPFGGELGQARTPTSCLIAYGPFDEAGTLRVRLYFDHRIFDGALGARALARIEEVLHTSIRAELAPYA
jgi:hypothetical protein